MSRAPDSGFSLAELLVSIMVFSVGVLGFATAVGVATTEIFVGGRDTRVAMLALDQMERLKAQGHEDVEAGARTEGPYSLQWEVRGSDPKEIVLVVTYPAYNNAGTRADTLVGYIPR